MGQALEAKVDTYSTPKKNKSAIDEYCDYVLYLYLAKFEPDKFRRTALYIDEPENYPQILEKYEEKLNVLPPKARVSILDRLKWIEYIYSRFYLFDGMRDYNGASIYFSRRFILVVDKPFPAQRKITIPDRVEGF